MRIWVIFLTTVLAWLPGSLSWHAFDNTPYHCWDHTASAVNTIPHACEGFDLRYVQKPDENVKAEEPFDMAFELVFSDTFYTWAYSNGYFDGISGTISDAATAKSWCETTACPVAKDATMTNCCIWHVNVHSCPLAETVGGLCGPWLKPDGTGTYTHSDVVVGPTSTGNWTCHIAGLYQTGVTSLIAHFKIAGMQVALETKVNVHPRAVCGNAVCESVEGEDCGTCPADCGKCPLAAWQLAAIIAGGVTVLCAVVGGFIYIQYQKRKLFWDESWIIPYAAINQEHQRRRGTFGSMMESQVDLISVASNGTCHRGSAGSVVRKQVFAKTCTYDGRSCAIKYVQKREFSINKGIRCEVKETRECDHANVCRFVGACVDVPNVCILTEYCPKGSLSDVLLNDNVPLNWAFRFSFAADIAHGMNYLHGRRIYHGRLMSNNCVVDDRWTVKISDYGLRRFRLPELGDEKSEIFEIDYQERRAEVYSAPELANLDIRLATEGGDVYAFGIILLEIAVRNDPYGDEDMDRLPRGWKPELPDLSVGTAGDTDDPCPCSAAYTHLIQECWHGVPDMRPRFSRIQRIIRRINPNKLSPVDLMMTMMEKYSKHLELIVTERTQDLVAEKAKTDRLLHSMLPRSIADELRLGRPINAEIYDSCTIFFSDIVGFTAISGASTPVEVVGLLNKLYTIFDEIIDKYQVYKVETIGDAYMVVSGIPEVTPFHAREIANMAIDLVQAGRQFVIPHMPTEALNIRVGLHSGSACAGVVGLKMPRYCLFGDTVNTTSRMESNGEANRIHMSNSTYEELEKVGGYRIEQRGTITVKGKGEMLTWWLHGHDYHSDDSKQTTFIDEPVIAKINGTARIHENSDTVKKSVTLNVPENAHTPLDGDTGMQDDVIDVPSRARERAKCNGYTFTPVDSPSPDLEDFVCPLNSNCTDDCTRHM